MLFLRNSNETKCSVKSVETLFMDPKKLPIYELRDELAEALKSEHRIIIEAPTGSGKSTQVPQIVLDCRSLWYYQI